MQKKSSKRIASSELASELFGDISKYQRILLNEKKKLIKNYSDINLDSEFKKIDTQIINICPMVLCDALLKDLSIDAPDKLLAGLGLSMFSISTHDDAVDELPSSRSVVAGLTYSGNIATLEGINILINENYRKVVEVIIHHINKNHYYQTKIVETLWKNPANEVEYLKAIDHTKYWAAIGLCVAVAFAENKKLQVFIDEFSECYGKTCQIFDDMREIKDDLKNKYWSLSISTAVREGWDLNSAKYLNKSIERPRELAIAYLDRARKVCGSNFPNLSRLVDSMERVGCSIKY